METYTHLTLEERYQIEAMLRVARKWEEIAQALGRAPSTIKREVRRNRGVRGYRAQAADALACARLRSRAQANARRIGPEVWELVHRGLERGWTPEQISGELRLSEGIEVSHESIYLHVYENKRRGGELWRNLPCKKARRRRHGAGRARRHLIPNRVGIEQRPAIVDRKGRRGDWEGDTIVDGSHREAIVSLVERDTMYVVLSKVSRRTTEQVCGAIVRSLKALGAPTHTLTLDNGSEFCGHERITEQLGMRCYFARPYAAWQRGLNENHNGLVRRYIPKRSSLAQYTQADLDEIAHQLNHRPRKTLGYQTPTALLMRHSPRKKSALRN